MNRREFIKKSLTGLIGVGSVALFGKDILASEPKKLVSVYMTVHGPWPKIITGMVVENIEEAAVMAIETYPDATSIKMEVSDNIQCAHPVMFDNDRLIYFVRNEDHDRLWFSTNHNAILHCQVGMCKFFVYDKDSNGPRLVEVEVNEWFGMMKK